MLARVGYESLVGSSTPVVFVEDLSKAAENGFDIGDASLKWSKISLSASLDGLGPSSITE